MTPQPLQELQQQYQQARDHYLTLKGRDVDQGTLNAAIEKAMTLKHRLDSARSDSNMLAELDRITAGMNATSSTARGGRGGSIGQQILNSEMGQWLLQHKGHFPTGMWTSPSSEIGSIEMMATTLDESGGSGGPLVITDVRPGIVPLLTRRLVVADLLAPGTTNTGSITYLKETTFTNAAASVAEGAAKPESTLVFAATTDQVRKIAHWIPVTDEILQDVAQMQSYVDGRLRLGVQLAEDDQLLNGDGIAPNTLGLMNRSGLATAVVRGADTNADAIAKQISAIATNANLQADGVIMHPTNFLTVQLAKDANGNYYDNGGPFGTLAQPRLWGLPVALTTAIALGTALVGAFRDAAQIFRNGGLRVEATNSHSDFFTKNLIAIRAEERLALAVYRASAIGKVTGLV